VEAHRQGQLQEAQKLYGKVLKSDPGHFDALRLLGILHYQQGQFPEALRLIAGALKTNSRSTAALSDQALVLGALNRHAEALESYDKVLAIAPDDLNVQLSRGHALHALGRYDEAIVCFDRILARKPGHADALCSRANTFLALKRYTDALQSYDAALSVTPGHINSLYGRGTMLVERGDHAEAVVSLRRLLVLQPNHIGARNNIGQALLGLEQPTEALPHFEHVLAASPQHLGAIVGRSRALCAIGRTAEADAGSGQALALAPELASVNNFRAYVLLRLDRHAEALAFADKALALKPDYAEALNNRGAALTKLGRFEEALASCDRAIELQPDYAEAFSNRGHALHELRRFDDAFASCDRAIALKPDYADAYSNRGNTLTELARLDEAFVDYERATTLKPDLAAAWLGRGNLLLYNNHPAEALAAFTRVMEIEPQSYKGMTQLGWYHSRLGDMDAAVAWIDKALAIQPDFADAISNRIFFTDFSPASGFAEQQAARRLWWEHVGAKIAPRSAALHHNDRDPERRLVLGYVSSDFRHHSAAISFGPVLRNHDKAQFEIVCYSCSVSEDETTEGFKQAADRWHNASQLSDEQIGELVRADRVDILIDLSGHSAGNRLKVFAGKPAPVQVTAWGHATGTGIPTIDYLFSDPVTIPDSVRHLFSETIYDLPCALSLQPPPEGLASPEPPMLSHGAVTFGVLNRVSKISDEAIVVWSQILNAIPDSRLLIKDGALEDASLRGMLTGKFSRHGVSEDRLILRGRTPREEHLLAFRDVDICLDPFPQNGGVSTWEALQMGVPVVAALGKGPANRISASILTSIGLSDWVADDVAAYRNVAMKFAAMPEHVKPLRQELPERISNSAAGDNVKYTRAVEHGYRTMWKRYCLAD
jgi:predicted O-linked N-acetylglucosamine transferase (SPINDLY family)